MRKVLALVLASVMLLLPAPAEAASVGNFSVLWGVISAPVRLFLGLAKAAARVPTGPRPVDLAPDPIFGSIPSPKRLSGYAQSGAMRQVLAAIRQFKYTAVRDYGPQYEALRQSIREQLLALPKPQLADLKALAEDSRTTAELAPVLKRIAGPGLQHENYEMNRVYEWARGRMRFLAGKERESKRPPGPKGPPGPPAPPAAPARKPAPPQPPPAPAPPSDTVKRAATTIGWLGAVGAWLAAIARSLPPVVP